MLRSLRVGQCVNCRRQLLQAGACRRTDSGSAHISLLDPSIPPNPFLTCRSTCQTPPPRAASQVWPEPKSLWPPPNVQLLQAASVQCAAEQQSSHVWGGARRRLDCALNCPQPPPALAHWAVPLVSSCFFTRAFGRCTVLPRLLLSLRRLPWYFFVAAIKGLSYEDLNIGWASVKS